MSVRARPQLRILGRWAPFAPPGGACPGYLVGDGLRFVLLDCGHGVASRLLAHIDLGQLEAVFLTHLHPDHWFDLPALRHALRARAGRGGGSTQAAVPLFVPSRPEDFFSRISSYGEAFAVHPLVDPEEKALLSAGAVCPGQAQPQEIEVGPLRVRLFPTRHALPAYCLELACGGRKLFYTGDTAWWEGLVTMAAGAHTVLAEASLLEADRELVPHDHLTAAQAAELARRAGAQTLILTHLWPEYDPEKLRAEASRHFSGKVLVAEEDAVYPL
ncbi:MAG: MBL fold metallo-hydrolase [Moorellales bacterium]